LRVSRYDLWKMKENLDSSYISLFMKMVSYLYGLHCATEAPENESPRFVNLEFSESLIPRIIDCSSRTLKAKWDVLYKANFLGNVLTSVGNAAWARSKLFSTKGKLKFQFSMKTTNGWCAIGLGAKGEFRPGYGWDEAGKLPFYYNVFYGCISDKKGFGNRNLTNNHEVTIWIDNGTVTCALDGKIQFGSWNVPDFCCLYVDIYNANTTATILFSKKPVYKLDRKKKTYK